MGRLLRPAVRLTYGCLALTALHGGAVAQTVAAVLIANDAIYARRIDSSGAVLLNDSHPPGVLTNASVTIGWTASLSCSLSTNGDEHVLELSMNTAQPFGSSPNETHADLTLWLLGPSNRTIGLDLDLRQGGDNNAEGLLVDVGDDGTIEYDTMCPFTCHDPTNHRGFHWSFSNGPLPIRVRADDSPIWAFRGFSLDLRVRPWIAEASPEADGCAGIAWHGHQSLLASSNAHLSVEASSQPNELGVLRALGFGNFGAFLVSAAPGTTSLTLPSPFLSICDVLAFTFADSPGTVSATMQLVAMPPREWTLPIPTLPPGLTFYLQHASVEPTTTFPLHVPPWFGTSNVIRLDT